MTSLMRTKLHWLPFRTESTTSCPRWRTNADTAVHLLIYPTCVPRWRTFLAVRIFVLLPREISRFQEPTQQLFGPRGFSVSCPSAWNALPSEIKDDKLSIGSFKNLLKTHYFLNLGNCLIQIVNYIVYLIC